MEYSIPAYIPAKMDQPTTDISQMEPMLPEENSRALEDIAFDLIAKANSLAGQINPVVTRSIGNLVRSMNCYYSNFIESVSRESAVELPSHKGIQMTVRYSELAGPTLSVRSRILPFYHTSRQRGHLQHGQLELFVLKFPVICQRSRA